MKSHLVAGLFLVLALASALAPVGSAEAADAVVSGACDEAAFDAALSTVQSGSGGTITFNCGTAPFYVVFTAQKWITANVVIDGGNLAILSGGNSTRLFVVDGSLTLKNITVRNGNSQGADAGAIYSTGSLVIDNSHLLYNTTGSEGVSGGAILNTGPLTITNSELAYNTGGGGGAVYPRWSAAVTTISNSVFHDNQATNTAGSGWGGALLAWDGAPVTVTRSTFASNSARLSGGAMYIFANSILTMSGSTVSGNQARDGNGLYVQGRADITDSTISGNWNPGAGDGGGLYNSGVANLTRVTISFSDIIGYGGGIYNDGTGTLVLQDSTLYGNSAFSGGGLYANGTTTVINSTVANNVARYKYAYGGGIYVNAAVSMNFVTLLDNQVSGTTSGFGPSIYRGGGTLTIKNSIVKSVSPVCEGGGAITSNGFNIATDGTCSLTQITDKANTDPQLGPLGNHGGATWSALPNPGSPALDAGACGSVAADQRGVGRPQGAACDIGAVERRRFEFIAFLPLIVR
jgi:hypothetical protein